MIFDRYDSYEANSVEWLDEAPQHWERVPIKHLALGRESLFLDGDWIESKDLADSGIRYLTTGNVGEGDYKEQGAGFITAQKFRELNCTEVFPGDMLVSRLNRPIGRSCIVPDLGQRIVTSVDNVIIRADSKYLRQYLVYLFSSNDYFRHTENLARGATMQRISRGLLGNIRVVVPPNKEQIQIAAFLDHETSKIDALIAKQQELIALLQEKRQAVISHAVTKGLDPQAPMRDSGIEWLGKVPEHWTVSRIKQIANLESGHTPSKSHPEYWIDCDIDWVSLNDTSQLKYVDYIENTKVKISSKGIANSSARLLPARCVVFTRDASIGLAAITVKEMAVSQHLIAWVCDPKKVLPEYLLLVFYAMEEELERYTSGATLRTIGMPVVNRLAGAFPCLDEQKAIVQHVGDHRTQITAAIAASQNIATLLQERRTALISAAVTGKIDVRDWKAPAPKEPDALEVV